MKLSECKRCSLSKKRTQVVKPLIIGNIHHVFFMGEAPGCITGDSLINLAFIDRSVYPDGISIKDLIEKNDLFAYSFDIKNQKLVIDKIKRVWKTGRKKVYKVTYEWKYATRQGDYITKQKSIKVTLNHLFLMKRWHNGSDPFKGIKRDNDDNYLSINKGLKIDYALQPFHCSVIGMNNRTQIGAFSTDMINESRFLLEYKINRKLMEDEECHHDNENKIDNSWNNLCLVTKASHARIHMNRMQPMYNKKMKAKHTKVLHSKEYREKLSKIMKGKLRDPLIYANRLKQIQDTNASRSKTVKELFKTPKYYLRYLLGRRHYFGWSINEVLRRYKIKFPDNHKIVSIEYIGIEDVYDIEMEKYHNFAVNGIFVHNSNEDRYGKPFYDSSRNSAGYWHWKIASKLGTEKNCIVMNTVQCRPLNGKKNGKPTSIQIYKCSIWIKKVVDKYNFRLMILYGTFPIQLVLGTSPPIKDVVGRFYKTDYFGKEIVCFAMYHPATLVYDNKKYMPLFDEHIRKVKAYLQK